MEQERLFFLGILSIYHELANSLDFDDVINDFASRQARKI